MGPKKNAAVPFEPTGERLRVLLIGINYAPELTGIAPYTTELAEHYAEQGHVVRVVTGLPSYPEWRRLPLPRGEVGTANPGVRRYWHFIPRRPTAFGRMLYELTWLVSASRGLSRKHCDAIIGVVPSLSGGALAVASGRLWRVPVGLIVWDLIGPAAAQSGYQGGRAVAGVTTKLEAFIVKRANRVAIITDGFGRYLEKAGVSKWRLHKARAWTHPGTPTETPLDCRKRLDWGSDFICLHSGNMGQKQSLDTLIDTARLLDGEGIRIVLAGDGNDRPRLVARVQNQGIRNVSFLGLQSPGQYESMLRAADVLLLNQRASVGDMSLPSKLSSYFVAGRPVVAAVAENSDAAAEVEAAGGVVVPPENPAELALAIRRLRRDPEQARLVGIRGQRHAQGHLTPQAGLKNFDDFLIQLLASSRRQSAGHPAVDVDRAPSQADAVTTDTDYSRSESTGVGR